MRVIPPVLVVLSLPLAEAGRLPFGGTRRSVILHESFIRKTIFETIRGGGGDVLEEEDEYYDEEEESEQDIEEQSSNEEEGAPIEAPIEAAEPVKSEALPPTTLNTPFTITVKTALGNQVLDQTLELTVNRSRDMASIKKSLSRVLPAKPPVEIMKIVYEGRVLPDEMLLDEIMDDDDEDEEEDEHNNSLTFTLDMIPPVDPKFVPALDQQLKDMTLREILDAYIANEAALYESTEELMKVDKIKSDDEDEEESVEKELLSIKLKERSEQIRKNLDSLLQNEQAQKLLAQTDQNSNTPSPDQIEVRGQRQRKVAHHAGLKTTIKSQIQRNLNVNWPETIRYFLLFIFFGYFGGRTPFSRAVLLLGAPSVFLLQFRPVKLAVKQAFYALLDHPPGIFLSLLPAPQQAILNMDYVESMRAIYGDTVAETSVAEQDEDDEADDEDDLIDDILERSDDDSEESDED